MAIADLAYVDATGFHYADYPTVLAYYQAEYRNIYGADVYLEADSQDGQWIAIQAQASYDLMSLAAATYNAFSPATSQSDALSRGVRINGIARRVATYSNADLTIVGQAGTVITNGQAQDLVGIKWNLPASVTIPLSGEIVVNATAETLGEIQAGAGTINKIYTPTRGWQTVNNLAAAVAGEPVENDADLRTRQSSSTALPSLSVLDGTLGAVANVTGVTRYKAYENDQNTTDSDGLPPHSIAIIAEGGSVADIANAIAAKKTPGTDTYGTTSYITYDQYGVPNDISFFRPTDIAIGVEVTITALQGYTTGYEDLIKQSVADYINSLDIGAEVYHNRLYTAANLGGTVAGSTFFVDSLLSGYVPGVLGTSNLTIAFDEAATCSVDDVTIVVTP